MRTVFHPVLRLLRGLAAFLILGLPPVSAQAVESRCQDGHLQLVKHVDPQLPAAESVAEPEPAPLKQVLIATETSHFKEAVVAEVAETLCQGKQPLLVKRIDLNRLAAEPIQDYHAIVLINSCRAWRPSSTVREFLKSANDADKKKLVVLTTANSGECDLKVDGVDAISAASKRTGIAAVSQTVVDMVRARLAAP